MISIIFLLVGGSNLQFVKKALSVKHNKVKCNRMRCACKFKWGLQGLKPIIEELFSPGWCGSVIAGL